MIANSPIYEFMLSGTVSGVHVPFWAAPGFAIPLIQREIHSNALYVQKVGADSKVTGFDYVDFLSLDYPYSGEYRVVVGGDEVFAMMDPHRKILVGTRTQLSENIVTWLDQVEDHLTRYSFAKFCRNQEMELSAAAHAYKQMQDHLKDVDLATSWFVQALIIGEIRKALPKKKSDRSALENQGEGTLSFMNTGARLIVELGEELKGSDLAHKLSKKKQLRSLFKLVRAVTGRELIIAEHEQHQRLVTLFVDEQIRLSEARSKIAKTKRQEDRLALVILQVLTDLDVGVSILKSHHDRAGFIEFALEAVRDVVGDGKDTRHLEARIASQISKLISSAYPMQRARLILSLAEYLSEFDLISATLRDIIEKSSARAIVSVKARVFDALKR